MVGASVLAAGAGGLRCICTTRGSRPRLRFRRPRRHRLLALRWPGRRRLRRRAGWVPGGERIPGSLDELEGGGGGGAWVLVEVDRALPTRRHRRTRGAIRTTPWRRRSRTRGLQSRTHHHPTMRRDEFTSGYHQEGLLRQQPAREAARLPSAVLKLAGRNSQLCQQSQVNSHPVLCWEKFSTSAADALMYYTARKIYCSLQSSDF